MQFVNLNELVVKVAKTKGWGIQDDGLIKHVVGDAPHGFKVKDLVKIMVEKGTKDWEVGEEPDVEKLFTPWIENLLDEIEGDFVLLTMGYKVGVLKYEGDEETGDE